MSRRPTAAAEQQLRYSGYTDDALGDATAEMRHRLGDPTARVWICWEPGDATLGLPACPEYGLVHTCTGPTAQPDVEDAAGRHRAGHYVERETARLAAQETARMSAARAAHRGAA